MERINVLVTAAGGIGHGNSITKALNLSRLNIKLIAADISSRLINTADSAEKLIVPPAGNNEYVDSIRNIIKKHSIHAWFTGCEQELDYVSSIRNNFSDLGVQIFLNDENVIKLCKNKFKCMEFLHKNHIKVPQSIIINSINECDSIVFFPCVVKPYIGSGASANVFICKDYQELKFVCTFLLNNQVNIIAQQYFSFDDNEYTAGVTSLMENGKTLNSIVMKRFVEGLTLKNRNKANVISSGITQGEFIESEELNRQCRKIAEIVGSRGPLNIQFRLVNGIAIPFEINPRFSGTTSARAMAGYNEPEFFIRKYVLNDSLAEESLAPRYEGYFVKGLDERYIMYEK